MTSTTKQFRRRSADRPEEVQEQAQSKFSIWLENPQHPSLQFKKVSDTQPVWSVRVKRSHHALGLRDGDSVEWFWIGAHDEYERMLSRLR